MSIQSAPVHRGIDKSPVVHAAPWAKDTLRKSGFTHARAAREIGQSRTVLTEWLNGTRELRRDVVAVLAHVVGCDIADLAIDGRLCPQCRSNVAGMAA